MRSSPSSLNRTLSSPSPGLWKGSLRKAGAKAFLSAPLGIRPPPLAAHTDTPDLEWVFFSPTEIPYLKGTIPKIVEPRWPRL